MIKYVGKRIREEKGLTGREVAKRAGISSGNISKWERGVHLPDLKSLDKIANVLDVHPWNLVVYRKDKK